MGYRTHIAPLIATGALAMAACSLSLDEAYQTRPEPQDATDGGVDVDAMDAGPDENLCDGVGPLQLDGTVADVGDFCGPCGLGVAVCESATTLRCEGASASNACGGCGALEGVPDDPCGQCEDAAAWTCEGTELGCPATVPNVCGACSAEPSESPGHSCNTGGSIGIWSCLDDTLSCADGVNACGGTVALSQLPGTPCGTCGLGAWACSGPDEVVCSGETIGLNTCGGCGPLRAEPGDDCGCSGTYSCTDAAGVPQANAVTCLDATTNACGGCEPLSDELGSDCEDRGEGGTIVCAGGESICHLGTRNQCGGVLRLSDSPGDSCGPCDSGVIVCAAEEATACVGALPEHPCGGCGLSDHAVGDACGENRAFACTPTGLLTCQPLEATTNACGTAIELSAEPGSACGACDSGRYACDAMLGVACIGDLGVTAQNECGGCGPLDGEPGDGCGACGGTGTWECTEDDVAICTQPTLNACGGCTVLDDPLNGPCGDCMDGVFACDGTDATQCLAATPFNECGGCDVLPGSVSDSCCGGRGMWICNVDDGLTCSGVSAVVENGFVCDCDEQCTSGTCGDENRCTP